MLDADVGFVHDLLDVFSFPGPKDYMLCYSNQGCKLTAHY